MQQYHATLADAQGREYERALTLCSGVRAYPIVIDEAELQVLLNLFSI